VTARLFGLDRIAFFENGVVSLNLPPVAQVVGARATRTTHPQAMAGFRIIFSELLRKQFDVINPFMWLTKANIVERISARGFSELIRDTRSCTRVHDMTILNPHCGKCSQCIDRRFAMIAAGQAHNDPDEAYKVDLLLGERPAGPDREMALAYVRSASDINQMEDVAFFSHYGEVSRAVGFLAEPTNIVAERIFDLHRRHAAAVCKVFDEGISTHRAALREGKLPPSCLLSLILSQRVSDVDAAYPERVPSGEPTTTARPEIRMAIDESRRCVLFDRWGEIKGMLADLLISLAGPYREATSDERMPQNYPFTKTEQLLGVLRIDSAEMLRRHVLRCRKEINRLATEAGDTPPSIDAVIETSHRRGYRLNPDTVRIVAITEPTARKKVTLPRPKGHAS
jgi:Queuosine biosynthesis protein QueC